MPPSPVKRESDIARRPFPFEILHARGPANNMPAFHWHDFMELSFVRRGAGTYEIEDKVFSVGPGDIIIINDIERHRVTYDPARPLHETVLHFAPSLIWSRGGPRDARGAVRSPRPKEGEGLDEEYLRLFLYDGATFSNKPELAPRTRALTARLISEIQAEWEAARPWYQLMIKSKLLTIITHLLRECGPRVPAGMESRAVRRRNIARLEQIVGWLRTGYTERVSLADIARRFSMNPTYFSSYFRSNLGITFHEYLTRLRVQEAARLVAEDRMSATEIAFACGFDSPASFYRAYRRVTGQSPGESRKRLAAARKE